MRTEAKILTKAFFFFFLGQHPRRQIKRWWKLTSNGNVGHVLDGAGQGQQHANDHADDTKDNGTSAMVGDGVEHGSKSDDMATHDENGEEQLPQAKKFAAKAAQQDLAGIGQVMHMGVALTELANGITGIQGDETQADNEDDGGDETNSGQGCREGEDAERDGLGDHDCTSGLDMDWGSGIGEAYTFHIACHLVSVPSTCRMIINDNKEGRRDIPPLESLVLDLGGLFIGKRVDVLVVDGLDGLEVGFFIVFL